MSDRPTPPSRLWYAVGAITIVGGIGGAAWYGVSSVLRSVQSMDRIVIPGTHELEFAAGDHTVYYERSSSVDGVAYNTEQFAAFNCRMSLGGEPVEMRSPSMDETYSFGSRSGVAVAAFTADTDGVYTVDCEREGAPIVLAFGDAFTLEVIVIAIVLAFLGLISGAVLIALTYSRRVRAMRLARSPTTRSP